MLRYTLLVLLYITICSFALESSIATDTKVNALSDTFTASSKLSPCMNGNLSPAQQIIYIYGPNQLKMQNTVNLIEKVGNDYLITPGMGAHKLHTRKLPWNQARRICIQEGGHLAVINSNSEEKILLRVLEENKVNQAWLGVHDLYEEGDWNTIMDEALEATGYSKWGQASPDVPKEPNNYDGKQHCGVLSDGAMGDRECTDAIAFFCEITL